MILSQGKIQGWGIRQRFRVLLNMWVKQCLTRSMINSNMLHPLRKVENKGVYKEKAK
jgi:hypothetical protein